VRFVCAFLALLGALLSLSPLAARRGFIALTEASDRLYDECLRDWASEGVLACCCGDRLPISRPTARLSDSIRDTAQRGVQLTRVHRIRRDSHPGAGPLPSHFPWVAASSVREPLERAMSWRDAAEPFASPPDDSPPDDPPPSPLVPVGCPALVASPLSTIWQSSADTASGSPRAEEPPGAGLIGDHTTGPLVASPLHSGGMCDGLPAGGLGSG